jgi:hypothetical protein
MFDSFQRSLLGGNCSVEEKPRKWRPNGIAHFGHGFEQPVEQPVDHPEAATARERWQADWPAC